MKRSSFAAFAVAATLSGSVALIGLAQSALKSGVDVTAFDRTHRPQDDLFRHVNGGWLAATEIPADRAIYGTFVQLADRAEADLRAIIEGLGSSGGSAPGSGQIARLYSSFMNEAEVNRRGAAPLALKLAEIDAIQTTADLATTMGRLGVIGLPGAIGAYVEADAGDPNAVVLYLTQAGTALPDRDYYLTDTPRFVEIRGKYQQYLESIFTLAGRGAAADEARAVVALETELARIQWTRVESRDAVKTYNNYTVAKIVEEMPGFDWRAWAAPQGLGSTSNWIIRQPSFFKELAVLVPATPIDSWKAWLRGQLITASAPYLSQQFIDAYFELFARTLSGQQAQRDRWKRGVQLVNGDLGEAIGRIYVEKHFPAASKTRMEELVRNLIEAYRRSITELDWMTPATKQQALAKLAKFRPKIGYPSKWRDYGALEITADDLLGNVQRANTFEHHYQVGKLGRPVDREEWLMTPQTVNAYYMPVKNEIVFPAAILQPPFFDVTADDAVNYGAIGAVIGHEIGHGFDDQGRRFDGDGKLRDWWTPADETEFQKRVQKLVDQFSGYSPLPGTTVNGQLTLGENIGDLGGLSIAYQAWKISLAGRQAPVIDGLSGDQRFFMGWAQAWRAKARDEYLRRQVLADTHAWAEFRANGPLGNIAAFYDAFSVKPGDKLYREPGDRVKIW